MVGEDSKGKNCDCFSRVHRVDENVHIELDPPLQPPDIEDLQITEDPVRIHPGHMDISESVGRDGIHPAIIKSLVDLLAGPTCSRNVCRRTANGVGNGYPQEWLSVVNKEFRTTGPEKRPL